MMVFPCLLNEGFLPIAARPFRAASAISTIQDSCIRSEQWRQRRSGGVHEGFRGWEQMQWGFAGCVEEVSQVRAALVKRDRGGYVRKVSR